MLSYGASDPATQCVEWCTPDAILNFLPPDIQQDDTCADSGFANLVQSQVSVQPPGSPFPLMVNIYSNETPTGVDLNFDPALFYSGPCVDCEDYVALSAAEKLERLWHQYTHQAEGTFPQLSVLAP